jgi:hypothetical protein
MARPSSCTFPHSADKRRSNGTGAKEAGSNGRGGRQAMRALRAQSGSCTPLEAFKTVRGKLDPEQSAVLARRR